MVIINRTMTRNKALIRNITQSGVLGLWAGGGKRRGGGDAGGNSIGGTVCGGGGTGKIIGGVAASGIAGSGGNSVVKELAALQAL